MPSPMSRMTFFALPPLMASFACSLVPYAPAVAVRATAAVAVAAMTAPVAIRWLRDRRCLGMQISLIRSAGSTDGEQLISGG